jgi:hypothetical protein
MPITTEYVKKLFNPNPGAKAKGTLAQIPTISVPINEARHVIVINAPLSIPVSASILGCRNMRYDMVRKVVSPPIISCLRLVFLSLIWKNRSIIDKNEDFNKTKICR